MSDAEKCICCGAIIPEGRQVCMACEQKQAAPEAQTYTPKEFIWVCTESGYARRETAIEYVAKHAGRLLTDDDLIEVYREQECKLDADKRFNNNSNKYTLGNGSYTTKTIPGEKE